MESNTAYNHALFANLQYILCQMICPQLNHPQAEMKNVYMQKSIFRYNNRMLPVDANIDNQNAL